MATSSGVGRTGAEAVFASEASFRTVADSIEQMIWSTRPDGHHDYYNRRWYEYTGVPEGSTDGEGWNDMFHPEDRERAWAAWRRSLETGEPYQIEYRLRHHSGEYRWVLGRARPVQDGQGKIVRWYGTCTDVHDLKLAEEALRESEERFRAMADCAPAPVWVTGENGIAFVNRAFSEFAGRPYRDILGEFWMSIVHPDDMAGVAQIREAAWTKQEPYSFEARFRRSDGEWRWLRASCRPRIDGVGRFQGYVGMAADLTEYRQLAADLRESEARLRMALAAGALGDWNWDAASDMVSLSQEAAALFGIPAGPIATWTQLQQLMAPEDSPRVSAAAEKALGEGVDYAAEYRIRRPEGGLLWIHARGRPIFGEDGKPAAMIGVVQDVTARREAEEALRETSLRLDAVLNNTRMAIFLMDESQRCIYANSAAEQLTGYGLDEMAGRPLHDVIHHKYPDGRPFPIEECPIDRAFPEDLQVEGEEIFVHKDGSFYPVAFTASPIRGGQSQTIGTIVEARGIAQEKARDAALQEETRSLEALNRVAAAMAGELDVDRLVQMVTDAGVELSGAQFGAFFYNVLDEAGESYMLYAISGVDRSEFDKFPMPRNTEVFAPTFGGEGVVRSDDITRDPRYGRNAPHKGMPEGHLPVASYLAVPVASRTGEVIGGLFFGHSEPGRFTERHERLVVGVAGQAAVAIDNARLFEAAEREIGERRRAEEALRQLNQSLEARVAEAVAEREEAQEALRQAQKMEAIGQLTGGIAHDFNNLLTVITGNLDAARRHAGDQAEGRVQRALGNAMVGAERAAVLTQRLLAFSRRQPLAPKAIDPNRLVEDMSELLHRTLGEPVEVDTALAPDLWPVEVDPHQLENALLNLAVNARDAMPHGGRMLVETANLSFPADAPTPHLDMESGDYVAIRVSDTGIGMDEDTLARAVEPFFTTKEVGKGTGLGLSMVYGFVRQSGGHLRIESKPGEGTIAHIFLPRLAGEAAKADPGRERSAPEGKRTESVLVCEDDDDVRAYTVEVLRELGYRVLEAHDGPSALRLLERQEGGVDLLFTDVILPGDMTGAGLAARAREQFPELKILFTTGYARDAIVHRGRLDPGVELIAKPFAFADLASRIREILDRR